MGTAVRRGDGLQVKMTAGAGGNGGDVIQVADGRYGVVAGLKPFSTGDKITVDMAGEFEVTKKSSDNLAAGDIGYWDTGNEYVTSTSGGNVRLFLVLYAAGVGVTTVRVRLLEQAY